MLSGWLNSKVDECKRRVIKRKFQKVRNFAISILNFKTVAVIYNIIY